MGASSTAGLDCGVALGDTGMKIIKQTVVPMLDIKSKKARDTNEICYSLKCEVGGDAQTSAQDSDGGRC
jgi:hypothetical protein